MKVKLLLFLFLVLFSCSKENKAEVTPAKLTNNPSYDVTVTNLRPLLSFFRSKGGVEKRKYTIQLDTSKNFDSPNFIEYKGVEEENEFLVAKRVDTSLVNKKRYFWRVKAFDSVNNSSSWSQSRFYVDTDSNKHFMNMSRLPIKSTQVSTGEDPKNLTDLDDPGQVTFWQAAPPGPIKDWVKFDFGKIQEVNRIWVLSNINTDDGWLEDFYFEKSFDGNNFEPIEDSVFVNNDTYINTIDITPIKTRFIRLRVSKFKGVAAHLNAIIFYTPKNPTMPKVPNRDYVLIVGNQMNGGTFTQLAGFIESLNLNLKTVVVPHYEISLDIVNSLPRKPLGIILSGNNADYPHLPMFEYNGEFEIIRHSNIPVLGICCGHQMLAMTYGFTFVRSMGWEDLTALEKIKHVKPIHIVKEDPIFKNMKNPFIAPEIHGWAIGQIPDGFELLAKSTYVQAIRNKSKTIYGEQFHAEVEVPYNEGTDYLINFLKMIKNQ